MSCAHFNEPYLRLALRTMPILHLFIYLFWFVYFFFCHVSISVVSGTWVDHLQSSPDFSSSSSLLILNNDIVYDVSELHSEEHC